MVMQQSYISYLWLLGDGRWSSWCCSSCCSCPVNSCNSNRVSAPCSQSISPDMSQETCHDMWLWPICCCCYIWGHAFFFFFTFTAVFIIIIILPCSCWWSPFSCCCCSTLFVDLNPWCHVVDSKCSCGRMIFCACCLCIVYMQKLCTGSSIAFGDVDPWETFCCLIVAVLFTIMHRTNW